MDQSKIIISAHAICYRIFGARWKTVHTFRSLLTMLTLQSAALKTERITNCKATITALVRNKSEKLHSPEPFAAHWTLSFRRQHGRRECQSLAVAAQSVEQIFAILARLHRQRILLQSLHRNTNNYSSELLRIVSCFFPPSSSATAYSTCKRTRSQM